MRDHRIGQLFRSLGAVRVRVKIMGIVLGLVLLLGLGVTLQVRQALSTAMARELDKRAASVARDLAARSADFILTNNAYALYELLRETLENNEDVRYAFILDPDGNVLTHTFGQRFPRDLIDSNPVRGDERHQLEILATEEGLIHDVAVPIFEGRAGVARVGLTERRLHEIIATTTERLLASTALVSLAGILAAYFLTAVLTKPIVELATIAKAVGAGDLGKRAHVWARDELGQLSQSFNKMAEELQRKEELRGQLLVKVISAQEEERKRIARELHDQTSQSLASLMVGLRLLEGASTPDEVARHAGELREQVTAILSEVHDLALELRPSALDDLGLAAAMQRYANDYAAKTGINVDFEAVGFESLRLSPAVEIALCRIMQEALTNVLRHAAAHNVSVLLGHRNGEVVAVVEDDGGGFEVADVMSSHVQERRLGLFGMRERAALVGGSLTIESGPGEGTSVIVQVPLDNAGSKNQSDPQTRHDETG